MIGRYTSPAARERSRRAATRVRGATHEAACRCAPSPSPLGACVAVDLSRTQRERCTNRMTAYLIRRLLLVIPTLFGIIAINFAVIQFAPGGPVDQMLARTARPWRPVLPPRQRRIGCRQQPGQLSRRQRPRPARRRRHQEDVRLRQAAADPLRGHGRRLPALRLRPQLLPRPVRAATHRAEDAGVDLARAVVHAAGLHDLHPARHRQGGARRLALRRRHQRRRAGRLRHPELPVRHPAGGAVRRRQLLPLVPAARPDQRGLVGLELSRRASPTISGTWCCPPPRSSPAASPA